LGRLSFTPATDIFKPLGYTDRHVKNRFGEFNYAAFARLRPGVGMEKALAELNVVQAAISASLDGDLSVRAAMEPLSDQIVGDVRRGLLVMMGAVGAVLLVLCVNIANLLLARAARRARESAIRTALGAGRGHLVRLVLAESLLLAMGGGLLGMAVAHLGLRLLVNAAPLDLPRLNEVRLDSSVLAFAFLLSLATGLIFGILPALRSAFADPQGMLRAGSHTTTEARHSVRLRGALVAVEAGLSVVLLVAAGLLASSFLRLVNIDKGFNVERVLAVDVSMPSSRYDGEPHREQFFTRLLETVRGLPGVQQASVISALPLEGETWVTIVTHENDPRPIFERPTVNMRFASPDYFKTLEIPLSAGRSFRESDRGRKVAVVSQAVARRLWPDQDPVGRRLVHRAEELLEVVGVTPDIRSTSLDRDPVLMMYVPYWQESRLTGSLLVRTAMEPGAAAAGVRGAIRHIDPEVPVPRMKSMEKVMADSVAQRKFQMLLIVLFAAAALALGCLGIYGVVSYTVARRRTEMGIRMALGASPGSLRTMVVRQGMLPVLSGLGAGLLVVLWAGRVLSSLLFHVSPRDPLILAGVALLLALVSALACLAPAVRATRVDPINVLRYE
jgi:putative ABC transport system permease protein